jgi:hypothetical protein
MKVEIVVGLGLGIGITLLFGGVPNAAEANASPISAPTRLVPESYTALSAPVASTALPAAQAQLSPASAVSTASPAAQAGLSPALVASTAPPAAQTPLSPPPMVVPTVAARATSSPASNLSQYHPHWVVDIH